MTMLMAVGIGTIRTRVRILRPAGHRVHSVPGPLAT
jgi:hypothetical protein